MRPSDEAETDTRQTKKIYKAQYGGATPEQVAAALKRPRPKRRKQIKEARRSAD